jgi:spore germination protein
LKYLKWIIPLAILWSFVTFSLVSAGPPDPPDPVAPPTPSHNPPIIAAWLQRTRGVPGPLAVIIAPRITSYNEISPHSYTIESDGSLTVNNPVADAVLIDYANANGVRYIPTVSSGWYNGARLQRILSDPKLRQDHIDAIMKIASSPNIDGIDLDYENLLPETRVPYTTFVTELAAALHKHGKLLSVTVPPKVRADDSCVICRYADYAALGKVVDRFRVMAYEYHGNSGGPGPIAPVWWMRQVMSYTISVVPANKVSLGIHLYGYDWGGADTPALWWNEVQDLKDKYNGQVHYVESDPHGIVGESVMTYTIVTQPRCPRFFQPDECPPTVENHTVWFVDAHYVAESWKIVQDFGLGGIVMWRPGGEDPDIWNILAPTELAAPRFNNQSGF